MLFLDLFAPLLKKWQTWVVLVMVALVVYVLILRTQLRVAQDALAARPKVETKIEVETKTVRVAGPVRVETKTVYVPGTSTVQYVDRIVEAAPVTTTTGTEKAYDRTVAPACPAAPRAPWRYAGALVDPLAPTKLVGLRGGVTLYDRVDLGLSFRSQPNVGQVEVGVRF